MGIGADGWWREQRLIGRRLAGGAVLALLTLASMTGWGDDRKPSPPPPEDPDASFLEFLGSVDRLAEVNPDYLTPAGQPPGAPAPAPKAASPPPPSPPSSGAPAPPSTSQARISSDD